MARVIYISHPEVVVDPKVPVPQWGLSPAGKARLKLFASDAALDGATSVWSSTETKARDGAAILAAARGLPHAEDTELGENDRSSTGFVPPPRFWELRDAFFARPDESVEGWETARYAQVRILGALDRVANHAPAGDIAVVAHGGVGALALAALSKADISVSFDQPEQGNWFTFDRETRRLISGWAPLPRETPGEFRP
jgi:broad specificity phosphatase PhoE